MDRYPTDQHDRPISAFVAVVVALLTGGYMLPWAVAALRGKSNHWTVALVMAFSSHKVISRY
jgi:hypothetical protein